LGRFWERPYELKFAVGIEDTFIPQTYHGRRSLDEYELTGHYEAWREDLDLAASTGAQMIRYGVPGTG
jgi:beta-glucosidase